MTLLKSVPRIRPPSPTPHPAIRKLNLWAIIRTFCIPLTQWFFSLEILVPLKGYLKAVAGYAE